MAEPDAQALAIPDATALQRWAQTHLGLREDRYIGMGSRVVVEPPGPIVFELRVMLTVEDLASLKDLLP